MTEEEKAALDIECEEMLKMIMDPANDKEMEEEDGNKENIPPLCDMPDAAAAVYPMPLIDHLCKRYRCSLRELQVLLLGLESRREIICHLRRDCQLRTTHLRPASRNFLIRCGDLTAQSVGNVLALGGYLGVTVRDKKKQPINTRPHSFRFVPTTIVATICVCAIPICPALPNMVADSIGPSIR
jgi:hypothetical protein